MLPDNFQPWEHLQDMIRRDHNRLLGRYFKDLGPSWEPEISTNRGAIRTAVTITDNETATVTLLRLFYFYIILGYAFQGLSPVFGVPSQQFQEAFELHPQIFLFFRQDKAATPEGLRPVEATISFRIKAFTKENINPAAAAIFAARIAAEFVENRRGITFNKGKQVVSYTDIPNKIKTLKIYAMSQPEGQEIIRKILRVLQLPFDPTLVGLGDKPARSSITRPIGTERVYNKTVPKKRWRPNASVRFRYAYLVIDNREYPVNLVDTTGRFPDAIVKTWTQSERRG